MITNSIDEFLNYFQRIRERTFNVIRCIPPDKIEWSYSEGKFTFGDLIRHIAAIERHMYAETVQMKPSIYKGCGAELANGYFDVIDFMNTMHEQSLNIFSQLQDEDLSRKCKTPAGINISIGKWLRAMIEHEVHHRGQLYIYLGILGIKTPPIFGLTSEELAEQASS